MFKKIRAVLGVFILAATAAAFAPTAAAAHYTGDNYSNAAKIGNAYEGHCGNGSTWACSRWPDSAWTSPCGAHSWCGHWTWRELYLIPRSSSNYRLCQVEGRVEHGAFVQIYVNEHCWWL